MAAKRDVKEIVEETAEKAVNAAGDVVEKAAKKTEGARKAARTRARKAEVVAKEKAEEAKSAAMEATENVREAAKKTGEKVKKAATRKTTVVLQFQGQETDFAKLEARVKEAYVAAGNKVSTMKQVTIYVKPEEHAAYYVINEEFTGRVDLF